MVGDATAITVDEARARAASLLAAIRCDADAPASPDTTRFVAVAETVFRRYVRVWKPQTRYVNPNYLSRQILLRFAGTQIADITRADVQRWFASRRATPVGADGSMPVLSVILKEAERMGYRPAGSNPCRGIRLYHRKGRERFLSDAEIGRLVARLSAHEGERPLQVDARSAASAHRVSQERGADASLVQLPGTSPLPARRQDRAKDGVAVRRRPQCPRPHRPHQRLGLPGTTHQWAGRPDVPSLFLVAGPRRSGPVRRAPTLPSSRPRHLRPEAGRERPRHRPAARTGKPAHHAQVHPPRRRDGARGGRDRRRCARALSDGRQGTHAPD